MTSGDDNLPARDATERAAARSQRIDALIRAAVPLDDSVPPELLARLGLDGDASAPSGNVVDLARVRAARNAAAAPRRKFAGRAGFAGPGWSAGRVAAQLVLVSGIALLGALWLAATGGDAPQARFHTLSDAARPAPAAPAANAIAMFAADTPPALARQLLSRAGARALAGPGGNGVWKLSIDPARRDAVLASLRQTSGVTLAEPVDGASR